MAVTVVLTPVLQKAEKCRFYQEIGGCYKGTIILNQRTNGPVNAHLISWPSKAQNIQNLENIW